MVDYTDKGKEFFKSGGFDKLKKAYFINENKKSAREVVVSLKESHQYGIEMILNLVNCFQMFNCRTKSTWIETKI